MINTAIITARMSSNRLPGKILLENKHSNTIGFLIDRLRKSQMIDEIVVATTKHKSDDQLVDYLDKIQIKSFRGSEHNVLERVYEASVFFKSDMVTFVTGDCPLIDYQLVDQCIRVFLNNNCDFVANNNIRSFPDGMDCQVFSSEAIKRSNFLKKVDKYEEEHVTVNIRRNKNLFKIINVVAPKELFWPELGLTLDELNDYELITQIINKLYFKNKYFNCYDIIKFLKNNAQLLDVNQFTERNEKVIFAKY